MKKIITKKAFTLVELIVVITILAILATIAFIYWQSYVKDTRDVVRITDMWSVEKALRLYAVKNDNQFPKPDNSVEVSYSWAEVWTQWEFWETVFKAVELISEDFLDPDTLEKYPYSVSNQWNEFEIWSIEEAWTLQTNKIINQVYAWNTIVPAIIRWNYNWVMLKVQTGSIEYIFALPSIISSDLWTPTINYIINNKKLVYSWYWNLPETYKNSRFKVDWWWNLNLVNLENFIVFSWSIEDLKTNETKQLELITNLQEAYSWTIIKEKNKIKEILGVDSVNEEEQTKYLAQSLIRNSFDPKMKITASNKKFVEIPFITTWRTSNTWATNDNQIMIWTRSDLYTYDYQIDWWDWSIDDNITWDKIHTYNSPWTYTVKITGKFPQLYFSSDVSLAIWGEVPWVNDPVNWNKYDNEKILSVEQWWNNKWKSMKQTFYWAKNLVINASDVPDLSKVTDMSRMFTHAISFNQNINNWNVSNITNMQSLFLEAYNFNQPLNNWNVSNVENMVSLFYYATSFNENINSWNTSNVTNMMKTFRLATSFNKPLNNWDVSNVTNMYMMFYWVHSFDQDLTSWDTKNVTTMRYMFGNATSFNWYDLSGWNVDKVIWHSNHFRFFVWGSSGTQPIWIH